MAYYTLSAYSLGFDDASGAVSRTQAKKFEGNMPVPMILLGYMGKHKTAPANTGSDILLDAARRAHRSLDIASWGLFLHAEGNNPKLVKFYEDQKFVAISKPDGSKQGHMFAKYSWLDSNLV
jgi:hypothetical protein